MLDLWMELPWWLRLIVALGLMLVGALVFWFVSIKIGLGTFAVGFVLLLMGGKSSSEKKGYRF